MTRRTYAPTKYIQGKNELQNLYAAIQHLGTAGAYAVVDPYILDNYRQNIEASFSGKPLPLHMNRFEGECSQPEIDRLLADVKRTGADIVLGIGGGKALDTAKAVAFYAELPAVIIPTAASTDAPCSALSVLYTPDGQFDKYLFLRNNPDLVLVDTAIVANAPVRLLGAGMGDALATYFEARACQRKGAVSIAGGVCSVAALALAEACLDTLYSEGYKAKLAAEQHTVSAAVEDIIEANTYLSGLGFESGGLAGAHAIHNGLTVLPECHKMYHGEKVAFGTLVQLVLENAPDEEIEELLAFCRKLGLPTNLAMLGAADVPKERIMAVAEAACAPSDTLHNMPFPVTPEDVYSAILVADRLGAN